MLESASRGGVWSERCLLLGVSGLGGVCSQEGVWSGGVGALVSGLGGLLPGVSALGGCLLPGGCLVWGVCSGGWLLRGGGGGIPTCTEADPLPPCEQNE